MRVRIVNVLSKRQFVNRSRKNAINQKSKLDLSQFELDLFQTNMSQFELDYFNLSQSRSNLVEINSIHNQNNN